MTKKDKGEKDRVKGKRGVAESDLDEMPEWTDEDWKNAKRAKDVLPPALYEALTRGRGQRGPQKAPTKLLTSLRLDRDIVAYYKSTGAGWQKRINEALRGTLPR